MIVSMVAVRPKTGRVWVSDRAAKGGIHDDGTITLKGKRTDQHAKIGDHGGRRRKFTTQPPAEYLGKEVDDR